MGGQVRERERGHGQRRDASFYFERGSGTVKNKAFKFILESLHL